MVLYMTEQRLMGRNWDRVSGDLALGISTMWVYFYASQQIACVKRV
jgi:hypothetical protein